MPKNLGCVQIFARLDDRKQSYLPLGIQKISPFWVVMGEMVSTFFLGCFNFSKYFDDLLALSNC